MTYSLVQLMGAFIPVAAALLVLAWKVHEVRCRENERLAELRRRSPFIRDEATRQPRRPAAWDVSTTLDRCGYNGLWHYEDATLKHGTGPGDFIRVIPRSTVRPLWSETPPVTASWTVVIRAADPFEGTRLLEEALPALLELAPSLADPRCGPWYYRLDLGRLTEVAPAMLCPAADPAPTAAAGVSVKDLELGFARLGAVLGPCRHDGAVPVDDAYGETVAYLCPDPECSRQLPADWGRTGR